VRKKAINILLLSGIAFLIISCSPARKLAKNDVLLAKNVYQVDNANIDQEDIVSIVKQEPNRKIFGFRFHLQMYNLAKTEKNGKQSERIEKKLERKNKSITKKNKKKQQKFEKQQKSFKDGKRKRSPKSYNPKPLKSDIGTFSDWLRRIGEEPVVLDTFLTNRSVEQINSYLKNKGYFNSEVSKNIIFYPEKEKRFFIFHYKARKKRAVVFYKIEAGDPYKIRNFDIKTTDKYLFSLLTTHSKNSLVKPGDQFDTDILDDERERITKVLKNTGYYLFIKDYIKYEVDSSLNSYQLDIDLIVSDYTFRSPNKPDSIIKTNHKQFRINNTFIYPDYKKVAIDTFSYQPQLLKPEQNGYYLMSKGKPAVNPKVISRSILFDKGELYKQDEVLGTHRYLSDLRNFKYINLQFLPALDTVNAEGDLLDCYIRLTRSPKQAYNIETEGTNSGGNLGIAGNLVYQNRNFFGGAEVFNFKPKLSMEIQKVFGETTEESQPLGFLGFNTFEFDVSSDITIPKFLIPVRQDRFPKRFRPKTNIDIGYNFQDRPDYVRHIGNVSYGYIWKETVYKQHMFNPLEFNLVDVRLDSVFEEQINSLGDQRIKNSYTDHTQLGIIYSFTLNNQKPNKRENFEFLRINAELFYAFTQFARIDFDFRKYLYLKNRRNVIVFRSAMGGGGPWGKTEALPFEKGFFVGGSNGIRAFRIRTLGPGSYVNTSGQVFERIGDVAMELNLEYRYPLYDILEGALFFDAGNMWVGKKNESLPNGEFAIDRFYNELALGTGLGFRLDFSFFVIRTDLAIPVINPGKETGHKFRVPMWQPRDIVLNFGIGYPF
jgi:outer membrane protein assembly factor BamA